MPNRSFYVLSNVTTGTDSEYATLDAALEAVDRSVDEAEQWDIHEFLTWSVARWITGGYGHTTSSSCACANAG